jgi:hypothetical protein
MKGFLPEAFDDVHIELPWKDNRARVRVFPKEDMKGQKDGAWVCRHRS